MRRRLVILALCLLAGAALSIASAMIAARWGELSLRAYLPLNPHPPLPTYLDPLDMHILEATDSDSFGIAYSLRQWTCSTDPDADPADNPYTSSTDRLFVARLRFGWPFRAMSCDHLSTPGNPNLIPLLNKADARAGYRSASSNRFLPSEFPSWIQPAPDPFEARYMPHAIEWPGFLANTLVYSLVLWLLAWVALAFHRHRRKRLGRCVTCGYSLDELVTCPECGTEARNRPSSQPC